DSFPSFSADPHATATLAAALAETAGRLEAKEAAALAPRVLAALVNPDHPRAARELAVAVAALAHPLGGHEAARPPTVAVARILTAAARTKDVGSYGYLLGALPELAGRLGEREAGQALARIQEDLASPDTRAALRQQVGAFKALAGRLPEPGASQAHAEA